MTTSAKRDKALPRVSVKRLAHPVHFFRWGLVAVLRLKLPAPSAPSLQSLLYGYCKALIHGFI